MANGKPLTADMALGSDQGKANKKAEDQYIANLKKGKSFTGTYQSSAGKSQAVLDAEIQAEQMRQMVPIEALQRLGQGITGVAGGMGTVQTQSGIPAAAPSPLGQAMTAGIGAFGLGKLFGLG